MRRSSPMPQLPTGSNRNSAKASAPEASALERAQSPSHHRNAYGKKGTGLPVSKYFFSRPTILPHV